MLRNEFPAVTRLRELAVFEPMDLHFANCLCHLAKTNDENLALAAALASRATSLGHVCIDLSLPLRSIFTEASVELPDASVLPASLAGSACVGGSGDYVPLVLEGSKLYLKRYHQYEQDLAAGLLGLAAKPALGEEKNLAAALRRLFPKDSDELDMQMTAAFAACRSHLAVITGGPGTGKTYVAARIVALLQELEGIPGHGIALAAPTGKAAARLNESLRQAFAEPALADHASDLPRDATTLHRLLGLRPDSPGARHHRDNPLPYRAIIVDEASMVSLPIMAKLVCALPENARLILLGDRDQLASVEAGAVLADICGEGWVDGFSRDFVEALSAIAPKTHDLRVLSDPIPPLADAVVRLTRTYRFDDKSGIAAVSRAVRQGDADAAIEYLQMQHADLKWVEPKSFEEAWAALGPLLDGYAAALGASSPEEAFTAWGKQRLLTPLRRGHYGVEGLNRRINEALRERGVISGKGFWHPGKPVMVTRNDPSLNLFNGDIGVALKDEEGALRVWFPGAHGGWRNYSPTRLTAVEEVYAMTVHKSQGAEFEEVYFIMPDQEIPVLTRELVYTAITRARVKAKIIGINKHFRSITKKQMARHSNLKNSFILCVRNEL